MCKNDTLFFYCNFDGFLLRPVIYRKVIPFLLSSAGAHEDIRMMLCELAEADYNILENAK